MIFDDLRLMSFVFRRITHPLAAREQDRIPEGVDSDEEKPRVSSPDKKRKLLDPNISVSDRVTDFFAAALGSAISNMYRTLGEGQINLCAEG